MRTRFVGNRLRLAAGGDGGFTMVEAIVALGVLFTVLLGLVHASTRGLVDIAFARQRQSATGIANKLLEQTRGLAYTKLTSGMATSDLSGDARVINCGGVLRFESCGGEDIVHASGIPAATPLNPHTGAFGSPSYPSTYSWAVYVTKAAGVPASGAYRVTAVVSWAPIQSAGAGTVRTQTLIYSPTGCTSLSTHPFAAPCEPFFFGATAAPKATLGITGTVLGLTFARADLEGSGASSNMQLEQIARVNGRALQSGLKLTVGGITTAAGYQAGESTADDDNDSGISTYQKTTAPSGGAQALAQTNGTTALNLALGGGNNATTTSTVAANASPNTCPPGPSPPAETDNEPCGYSISSLAGNLSASLGMTLAGVGINTTLASIQAGATPASAFTNRVAPAGSDGRLESTATRALTQVDLLAVPTTVLTALLLPGWSGYMVRLTSYQDSAVASTGVNTSAPSANSSGTISYWNGAGYSTLALGASATPLTVAGVNVTVPILGIGIQLTANLTAGGRTTTQTQDPSGSTTRTAAEAKVGAPLSGTLTYRLTLAGVEQANLTLDLDLGTISSRGTYRPAPTS